MNKSPLLIFDFDGVIVDGLNEYWSSARQACLKITKGKFNTYSLSKEIPLAFKQLRPWVNHGWEMVLIAAELSRPSSYLSNEGVQAYSQDYENKCVEALDKWQWEKAYLQESLDNVRNDSIAKNLNNWLQQHKVFPGIIEGINELQGKGLEIAILTTKGTDFTKKIVNSLGLEINKLYGHEFGTKSEVLLKLYKEHRIQGFIEDRRETLEKIINSAELNTIPCYLASWGYIKPQDLSNLPANIHILKIDTFAAALTERP